VLIQDLVLPCPSGRLYDNTENQKNEIHIKYGKSYGINMIQKGIHTEDFLCNGLTIASLQLLKRSLISDILL
jgi:hypothetical protein